MRVSLVALASLSLALAAPSRAVAQPVRRPPVAPPPAAAPSEAEVRFQRGTDLFNVRNFEGALVEFQRSYELSSQPGLLYNIARTEVALGRLADAGRTIERYLREATDLSAERRAEVEAMLAQTRSFLARIVVRVDPPEARAALTLDGDAVADALTDEGLAVGPGRHTLAASAEGWQPATASVLLASGDRREVTLTLRRAADARAVEPALPAPDGAPGRLVIAAAPQGAVARVDGRSVSLPAAEVAPGLHAVEVSAPGYRAWRGDVELSAGATRVITTRLASSRGLAPAWFIVGAATTGALLAGALVCGALTSVAHDAYAQRFADEYGAPDVVALRDRGESLRLATNITLGLAAAAGVATVVLFTQTRSLRASSAEVSFAPTPDGGAARLRFTF